MSKRMSKRPTERRLLLVDTEGVGQAGDVVHLTAHDAGRLAELGRIAMPPEKTP